MIVNRISGKRFRTLSIDRFRTLSIDFVFYYTPTFGV